MANGGEMLKYKAPIEGPSQENTEALKVEAKKSVTKLTEGQKNNVPLSSEQANKTATLLDNSELSTEEKVKAKESIKEGNFDFLNSEGIEGGILAVFLSIVSVIFSGNENEKIDTIDDSLEEFENIPKKTKIEFAKEAKKYAKIIDKKYGIPWEISLAQTILESGWGQSDKAHKYGVYFGVKGKGKVLMSTEDYGNGIVKEKSEFRTYGDLQEAFEGYAQFLLTNQRYSNAFKYTTDIYNDKNRPQGYIGRDPIRFLQEIKKAGYATDSDYVGKIANVMKSVEKRNV